MTDACYMEGHKVVEKSDKNVILWSSSVWMIRDNADADLLI